QMNIQQILEEVGVDTDNYQIDHTDVGSASGDMADYFFVEKTLQDALVSIPDEKIIPLNAIIDYDETKEKVLKVLDDKGIAHQ
ncbi:PTS sugar transporter subunit IIB, partial [Enterococcus faecalis]|uniref:PTS sugar transporter subunit IIB n=1 Tax=Enterococcus faecalis TaxID=1351 RepID=UPI003D6ABDB4